MAIDLKPPLFTGIFRLPDVSVRHTATDGFEDIAGGRLRAIRAQHDDVVTGSHSLEFHGKVVERLISAFCGGTFHDFSFSTGLRGYVVVAADVD
jgi:hypothetical protein